MTAASAPTRKAANRSGLWTFLRLLGGWATVAALAYLLWTPSTECGWPTLLFGWVLLTLLADEFAGWFGYMALALGILPLLHGAATPEQWYIILPLIGGAMFALLIMKHSGGPFVLPFGALIFAGTILGAAKFGLKIDPTLKLPASALFQRMALMPTLIMVSLSFVRQLIAMLLRWQAARRERLATAQASAVSAAPAAAPAQEAVQAAAEDGVDVAAAKPLGRTPAAVPEKPQEAAKPLETVVVRPTEASQTSAQPTAQPVNTTIIDIDLGDVPGAEKPKS